MKIISLVVGLTVGVLLMVGLVSPVVADGQTTAGDEITKTNQVYQGYYIVPDDNYELTISSAGWVANGVTLTNQNYRQLIFSDNFVLQVNTNTDETSFGYIMDKTLTNPKYLYVAGEASYTVTFANNSITVTKSGQSEAFYTNTYGWAFAACSAEMPDAWGTITRIGETNAYIMDENQVYLSGYYYTGENRTFYSYHNGTLYSGTYEGSVELVKSITSGTTDIYTLSECTVNVGDESFTPYLTLVPISVTGHATSGANYALLKAIPIVAFIALIAFAAFAVRGRMND